jgi:hypothetical protein
MYSAVGYDDIDYSPFGTGSGQAVPLEDYDYGPCPSDQGLRDVYGMPSSKMT